MRILKDIGEFIELVILAIFWKVFTFTGKEADGNTTNHGSWAVPAGTVHEQLERESREYPVNRSTRGSPRRETWNVLRR